MVYGQGADKFASHLYFTSLQCIKVQYCMDVCIPLSVFERVDKVRWLYCQFWETNPIWPWYVWLTAKPTTTPKKGFAGKGKNITTKHDEEVCGRKNTARMDNVS